MLLPNCNAVYLTHVDIDVECDTFFPKEPMSNFQKVATLGNKTERDTSYEFVKYERKAHSRA